MASPVRKAAVAGSWYPGEAAPLRSEVGSYLSEVPAHHIPGRLVGLISPHAGLHYSGPVAAHGYSLLRGCSRLTFAMVGPSHQEAFDGVAVVTRGAFETPLGRIPIDEALAAAILDPELRILDQARPHRDEHCLEMQLPFLQHLVPELKIVPMLMGSQSRAEVERLAGALAGALADRRDVVLVASSDLSHYQPAKQASILDALVVQDVESFDEDGLMARLEGSHRHACGGGPMVAVMKAARRLGANRATVLKYADSGDVPNGDKSRVVGYLSAALWVNES
ncbi:MAG TPA: AmmeMemoRadiSam system protein B [Vicinamibacteria bacterium]|nr:AmmeMemoRadiSam system protein B [Vicinamibacteria bacterium]